MALKIVFAGTAEFALPCLRDLLTSEHEVIAVYTKPDKPSGRGLRLTARPVKEFAVQHHLPLYQPDKLDEIIAADVMVDVACGFFLPANVLASFKFGCFGVHPSLLPRWRGAAPIQRAILAGDRVTGVSILQVDAGWDTGDILSQVKVSIGEEENADELARRLANVAAELLLKTLSDLEIGMLKAKPQDESLSCYAQKLTKKEAEIDWGLSAVVLDRMVRAYYGWPVAFSNLEGQIVKIWRAEPIEEVVSSSGGTIVKISKKSIDVATGSGILRILELQLPGGKVLPLNAVLNAKRELFQVGKRFNG